MTKEQYKALENLASEQLPNDGGYHWHELIDEANDRLGKIGKHGKRAKIKVTPKPGKPISAQFSLPGIGQKSYGLNLSLSKNNLIKAEEICSLITGQLVAGTFTMDWFYSVVGKVEKATKPEKPLTCEEMLEEYKQYFFKQRKDNKNPTGTWYDSYRHIEKTFLKYHDQTINLKIVREIIECTENNTPTRRRHLSAIANLLRYFDNNDYKSIIKKYKSENKPKPKSRHIPTDTEIHCVYQTGFDPSKHCAKSKRYRYPQWQFLYSLLAIYGLRVHEAWNIKNWDKPVTLKAGEWVAIADLDDTKSENENGKYTYHQIKENRIIPAILDPNNEDYLLCVGHKTKTGYRVAIPISPSGIGRNCNWIKEFNLVHPMNLPNVKNPLERITSKSSVRKCTDATTAWFNPASKYQKNKRNNTNESTLRYGFTAHALRHAYNIRAHKLGITPKMIANSLGHGMDMNLRNYQKHEGIDSKVEGIQQEVNRETNKLTKIRELQNQLTESQKQVAYLQDENKHLRTENDELKTKLRMYEAIKPKLD